MKCLIGKTLYKYTKAEGSNSLFCLDEDRERYKTEAIGQHTPGFLKAFKLLNSELNANSGIVLGSFMELVLIKLIGQISIQVESNSWKSSLYSVFEGTA